MHSCLVNKHISSSCRPHVVARCSTLFTQTPNLATPSLQTQRPLALSMTCRCSSTTDSSRPDIPIRKVSTPDSFLSSRVRHRKPRLATGDLVTENTMTGNDSPRPDVPIRRVSGLDEVLPSRAPHRKPRLVAEKPVAEKPVTENPMLGLRAHISRGTVTKEIASQSLTAFETYLHYKSANEQKAIIKKTAAGQMILNWLWDGYNEIREPEDRDLVNLMVKFLVAEGREDMAWDWMRNNQSDKPNTLPDKTRYIWRGLIAHGLVYTKSRDRDESLDQAFDTWFKLVDMANFGKDRITIPLAPATTCLFRIVTRRPPKYPTHQSSATVPYYPNTSIRKWQKFRTLLPRVNKSWEQDQAFMALRPLGDQKPDPFPALKLLQEIDSNKAHLFHKMVKADNLWGRAQQFRDCASQLETLGFHEKAAWVAWASDEYFMKKAKVAFAAQRKKPQQQSKFREKFKELAKNTEYTPGQKFSELAL